ncbi:MAG: hypothetical protein RML14_01535 [Meiothermus sp.]|uniref:hypothetical protein n=1 Tax=Meiothermus sp. TaxID=1955249 RepID=UPI00298F0F58|nr:hypothetical protein [Meiothermus sp.]MDW8480595.1 hypothetical protein [Meiothermus sp.]
MFNFLANLNPNDLMAALEELRASAAQMKCIEERMAAIQRMLEYEFGSPVRELPAHDPRNLPLIAKLTAGRVDVQAALGKPATRGHMANLGDNPADLYFESRGKRVGPYTLLAGATLDLSFALEALEIVPDPAGTTVQIFFQ